MPFVGEVEGDHGGFELGMPQVALDEPRIGPGFQQMGGIGMPEGRDGDTILAIPARCLAEAPWTLERRMGRSP